MPQDTNHDIVPTLRLFDGLLMNKAADEIERLRLLVTPKSTPDASLPRFDPDKPRRKLCITIEVPEDWENRLDMQWLVEREINADRWSWNWPSAPNA